MKIDTLSSNNIISQKLSQSGDIHPNPGPSKCKKSKKQNRKKSNIFEIFTIFIILLCHLQEKQEEDNKEDSNFIHLRLHFQTAPLHVMKIECYKTVKKKSKSQIDRKNYCIIYLLLLMSGDVEKNPGPTTKECNLCNKSNSSRMINCENCKTNYHITCKNSYIKTKQLKVIKEFTWVCPNQNCKPNYETLNVNEQDSTNTNRYEELNHTKLQKEIPKKPKTKAKNTIPKIKRNTPKESTYTLWNELTRITPKELAGHELCFKCHKKVIKPTSAACSICDRKAHMKCTNIVTKKHKTRTENKLICKLCSKDDPEINEKINIKTLNIDERPKNLDEIHKPQMNLRFLIMILFAFRK